MKVKVVSYLPMGSVVYVKRDKQKVMIFGRKVQKPGTEEEFDYVGCRYPQGALFVEDRVYFNHNQISMIFSLGYQDVDELLYKQKLNEIPEMIKDIVDEEMQNVQREEQSEVKAEALVNEEKREM